MARHAPTRYIGDGGARGEHGEIRPVSLERSKRAVLRVVDNRLTEVVQPGEEHVEIYGLRQVIIEACFVALADIAFGAVSRHRDH